MGRMPVDLVVFDLTGTTVSDDGAILGAFKSALGRHGVPFAEDDLASLRGAAKDTVFRTLVERALGERLDVEARLGLATAAHSSFKAMLREAYSTGPVAAVPGAEATMRWLRDRGVKVAATTGLDSELRDRVLSRLGWGEGLLDCRVSPDEVPAGRPAPFMIFAAMMRTEVIDVRRVAVVGDTPLDLQAGVNAGAGWVVAVLGGSHGLETLGSTRHTHVISGVAELPRLFE